MMRMSVTGTDTFDAAVLVAANHSEIDTGFAYLRGQDNQESSVQAILDTQPRADSGRPL